MDCSLLTISIHEANVKALATQGCPQGGVLSPLMWTMAVDDLLNLLGRSDIFAQAYVDDGVVSVAGKFTDVLSDRMQAACRLIQGWCNQHSLEVNPQKTKLILFTKKGRKYFGIPINKIISK